MANKTVKIGDEKVTVRGLKWGEKKALKQDGIVIGALDPEQDNDDIVEKVISVVLPDLSLDDYESSDVYSIFKAIMELTFLTADQVKN